jgi:hypothetical protein
MTGSDSSAAWMRESRSSPSSPDVVFQVDEDDVVVALRQRLEHCRGRIDFVRLIALALGEQAQRLEDIALVIADQQPWCVAAHRNVLSVNPAARGSADNRREA